MSALLLASDLDYVLQCTSALWEELRGERVFVTGGTGFIGSWLLETFAWANRKLNLGASALVLTRDPGKLQSLAPHLKADPAIQFATGDVRAFNSPDGPFTYVIHAASAGSANPTDALEVFHTTVLGTVRVLEAAEMWRTRKLLFISSGAVYGEQPNDVLRVPEDFKGGPCPSSMMSAYAEAKRAAETLCAIADHQQNIEIKIARAFTFVGPHLPLNGRFAIGNFIRDEMAGGPIRVQGDGTDIRSYLYAADLAIWLWTILFRGRRCEPYNVGSETPYSIADAARAVASVGGRDSHVEVLGERPRSSQSRRYVPSTRKAQAELDLKEGVDLRTALSRTMQWYAKRGHDVHV